MSRFLARFVARAVGIVVCLAAIVGCQASATTRTDDPRATATGGLAELDGSPEGGAVRLGIVETTRPAVEPGEYVDDPRVAELLGSWGERVGLAVESVRLRTGLHFPVGVVPHVQLEPLGDEDLPWRLEARVEEGRRVPFLRVNLERLAARREPPNTVLSRAVAAAVFEDASLRLGGVPAWAVRAGEIVASATFGERMNNLARRVVEEGKDVAAVDSGDPDRAESTALAAILVLASTREADAMSRFFRFTAEGDDPDLLLAREVQDPLGAWTGEGRSLLDARLARLDQRPWRTLVEARRALETLGRAGLEAELQSGVPPAVRGEITWLEAKAAADEGDLDTARSLLRGMDPDTRGRLTALPEAMRLWARVEDERGGDPARAASLRTWWVRAVPRRALASGMTPDAAPEAVAEMDGVEVRFHIARLLEDHRAGAARRVLESLGERASAPELEGVRRAVASEEEVPTQANLAANEARVLAWFRRPSGSTAADVRDGGTAAARALARRLPQRPNARRRDATRLLTETADLGRVVGLLAPSWATSAERLRADLDVLLGLVPYAQVHLWANGLASDAIARAGGESLWSALRFGLDPAWLQSHPDSLARLRDTHYGARRQAFDEAVADGVVTPELVGRALADSATLLRRSAATAAGRAGFRSLLQTALRDDAWVVRQAAAAVVPDTYAAPTAVSVLQPIVRSDPSAPVRLAAARALVEVAPERRDVVDGILAQVPREEPGVRTELVETLESLPKEQVIALTARGLRRELACPQPRPAMLAMLFRMFRQAAGWEAGYVPGMSAAELEKTVARVEEVSRRVKSGRPIR